MIKHDLTAFIGKKIQKIYHMDFRLMIIFKDNSQLTLYEHGQSRLHIVLRPSSCKKCGGYAKEEINLKGWTRESFYIKCTKCDNRSNNYKKYDDAFEEWENIKYDK